MTSAQREGCGDFGLTSKHMINSAAVECHSVQFSSVQSNSVLILSAWKGHQTLQAEGSVPRDWPPFKMPVTKFGSLELLTNWLKIIACTTSSWGYIHLLELLTNLREKLVYIYRFIVYIYRFITKDLTRNR